MRRLHTRRRTGTRSRRAACRGFTYLGVLWAVALAGALIAAAATAWSGRAEREAEREMRFRGEQIALALARWQAALPGAPGPQRLEELLLDTRVSPPRRHLRRLWADPASGQPDWQLERDEQGFIVAVRSASERPARLVNAPGFAAGSSPGLAAGSTPGLAAGTSAGNPDAAPRWRDHVFGVALPPQAAASVVPMDHPKAPGPRGGVKPAS